MLVEEGAPAIGQSHGGIPDRGQLEIGRNLVARANFGVAEERSQRARTRCEAIHVKRFRRIKTTN